MQQTETGREWHWAYAGESDRTKSLCNCNDGQHAPPYLAAMTARDTSLFSVIIADHQQATLLQHELRNLLAIIHRDGGHYYTEHGAKKAVEDAHLVWADLQTKAEQAALLPGAIAALRKVRSLIAEHDIDEVHPLTWVNLIADDLDPLIAKLADRTASQQEAQ